MEKDFEVKQENFYRIGLIKKEDGWYHFYCDGQNHYKIEKEEKDVEE